MQERYRYIDQVKAVGILMVVTVHLCNATGLGNPVRDWFNPFMLGMFFMVSGCLHSRKKREESFASFAARRLKSLGVPYVFFSLTGAFLQMVTAFERHLPLIPLAKQLFVDIVTGKGLGPVWFLPVMFFAELGMFLMIRGHKSLPVLTVAAAVGAAYCAPAVAGLAGAGLLVMGKPVISGWQLNLMLVFAKALVGLGIMVLGYYILPFVERLKGGSALCTAVVCFVITWMMAGVYDLDFNNFDFGWMPLLFFVESVLGTVFVMLCCRGAEKIRPWPFLSYLGQNTLIIMCTHTEWLYVPLITAGWSQVAGQAAVAGERYYMELIIKLFLVILMEVGTIELLRRYCPFIPGKSMEMSEI